MIAMPMQVEINLALSWWLRLDISLHQLQRCFPKSGLTRALGDSRRV